MPTADPAGSRGFYSGLFGWTYQIDSYPGHGPYTTALRGGQPVAGLAEAAGQAWRPVVWTLYLASANVMRTTQILDRVGGRVLCGPANLPGPGRVFIGVDPTGAVIGFRQPEQPSIFRMSDPGALFWAELNTWDGARADRFFADLFGYQQRQIGDGDQVDYTTWSCGAQVVLGRLRMNEDWADSRCTAHWMLHFTVAPQVGTDAAVDRVLKLGGRVDIDPYDTELGRIARVTDPFGASFALIDPTDRVTVAPRLPVGSARVDDPYDD
ncbi:MAG: VOC family protein [Pseudonocardiaceae bacterium]